MGNLEHIGHLPDKTWAGEFDAPASNQNRLIGAGAYDNAGNFLGNGTLSYDAENRIVSSSEGGTVFYTYDGDGERVQKSTGVVYWTGAGSETLAETGADGGVLAEYIYFGGNRVAGSSRTAACTTTLRTILGPRARLRMRAAPAATMPTSIRSAANSTPT